MSKVSVKANKKSQKTPVLKIVGIVFMIVTLLAALALTNNTVRQFITSSFAFDYECAQKGSPSARNECQQRNDDNRRTRELNILQNKQQGFANYQHMMLNFVYEGRLKYDDYLNIINKRYQDTFIPVR